MAIFDYTKAYTLFAARCYAYPSFPVNARRLAPSRSRLPHSGPSSPHRSKDAVKEVKVVMSDKIVKVALPMGTVSIGTYPLSPRPATLRGTTLGMVDNSKAGSDVFLRVMGNVLTSQYGVSEVIHFRKPGSTVPLARASLHSLMRCGAIISGVGD